MDKHLKLRDMIACLETKQAMQIGVHGEDNWEDCIDICAGSSLLKAYYDWGIVCMEAELNNDEDPISMIRIMIKRPEQ